MEKEHKTRQATIVITPSVYNTAREIANANRQSFNDLVQRLLEQYIAKQQQTGR